MSIIADPKFYHGAARLAEDPADGESQWQGLDLEMEAGTHGVEVSPRLWIQKPHVRFSLRIHHGDDDMAFHGMTPTELEKLGLHLVALSKAKP